MQYCNEQDHDKVYSTERVANCFPPHVPYICRICGIEGVDPLPPEMYTEFDTIKTSKNDGSFYITEVNPN
jgi:hypothetical protein